MERPLTAKVKEVWTSFFSGAPSSESVGYDPEDEAHQGHKRYTPERLQQLYEALHRYTTISEGNKSHFIETIRSIAEFMIWGDQHEPRIFDFFLENNIMVRACAPVCATGHRG